MTKNTSKICGQSLKIYRKSFQNHPKTIESREEMVLGAFSTSNCAQVGSRTRLGRRQGNTFSPFCAKLAPQGSIFEPLENRKSSRKRTFEDRRALGFSKNGLREGARKNRKISSRNRRTNGRFLMAWKHVWRYTLRLFHTFVIFEKNIKKRCRTGPAKSCFFIKKRSLGAKG